MGFGPGFRWLGNTALDGKHFVSKSPSDPTSYLSFYQIIMKTPVGIVKKQYYTFAEDTPMQLDSGEFLGPITLAYETYGQLNAEGSNAILICHALSGDSHLAGFYTPDDKGPGWWDECVGPGKAFDTEKYFIICSNVIGGCQGSTGPSSII